MRLIERSVTISIWTAYDAKFFNVKMPDNVPMTVQDRAYTSPIWYTPSS